MTKRGVDIEMHVTLKICHDVRSWQSCPMFLMKQSECKFSKSAVFNIPRWRIHRHRPIEWRQLTSACLYNRVKALVFTGLFSVNPSAHPKGDRVIELYALQQIDWMLYLDLGLPKLWVFAQGRIIWCRRNAIDISLVKTGFKWSIVLSSSDLLNFCDSTTVVALNNWPSLVSHYHAVDPSSYLAERRGWSSGRFRWKKFKERRSTPN